MQTRESLSHAIDTLSHQNYYGEDFELLGSLRSFIAGLSDDERLLLVDVAAERLQASGSIVDMMLCGLVPSAKAGWLLAELLNREASTSQRSRALLVALRTYASDECYLAAERFIDSDQEMDALQTLAEIDFMRALPTLAKALRRNHTAAVILHVLHDRRKKIGLESLLHALKSSSVTRSPEFIKNLETTLHSKAAPYNPFTSDEVEVILAAVREP